MGRTEPITGKYIQIDVEGKTYRTYYETSGSGVPLLCLHTAGGDSRQYRHLLCDQDIIEDHQVIAFDMPWHGRSHPPSGWWEEEYHLTESFYTSFIETFVDELDLDDPVLLGTSMGGYVIFDLLPEYADNFRGFVAIEPRAFETAWLGLTAWATHPEVNYERLIRPIIMTISSPHAPEEYRREVSWIYAQNTGEAVKGDLGYASTDHDARDSLPEIDAEKMNLYVIAGEWDYSVKSEHTDYFKSEIENLTDDRVFRMKGAGHYPPTENPEVFKEVIAPILKDMR